jgi:hypothetical protein
MQDMPRIMKVFWLQVATGFGIAALFVGGIIWIDLGGLWRLVSGTQGGYLAAILLWVLHGSVFAAVQFGIALAMTEASKPGGGTPRPAPCTAPPTVPRARRGVDLR